jgi:hypothetical protein
VFARSSIPENAIVKSGFCAVVELDGDASKAAEEYLSYLEDALIVISVFCRQRIAVLGWEVIYAARREQVWDAPLDPLSTKYLPYEPHNYLVDKSRFASLASDASKIFSELEAEKRDIFKRMSNAVTPSIEMQTSERFLAMFHALEACRSFAAETKSEEDNMELKRILEAAKCGVKDTIAKRIDGFIGKVDSKPSLRNQLEQVLVQWNTGDDLWPLFGNGEKLPGLKEIRDKLAHTGPKAIHPQSLAVATWHLSILLERVLLSLLNIPVANTSAAPGKLRSEGWYQSGYWQEQRKLIIK